MPPHKPSLQPPEPAPFPAAPENPTPMFLYQLDEHDEGFRYLLLHFFLPIDLLVKFDIDPVTLRNRAGEVRVHTARSDDGHIWGIRVLNDIDRRDPLVELEMADTIFNRLAVTWLGANDPTAPRFDIDHLAGGGSTLRGKASRNLEAEAAALQAGLAPGQVRKGLGVSRRLLRDLEQFFAALHHYEFEVEPLFYHNAILFERYGFQYVRGRGLMRHIHEGFAPGGELRARLDGSTPFRDPALADSIRGRSWAIHDDILAEPWDGVKLIKRIGVHAGEDTAPGVPW